MGVLRNTLLAEPRHQNQSILQPTYSNLYSVAGHRLMHSVLRSKDGDRPLLI
jgi:hypothetical protein